MPRINITDSNTIIPDQLLSTLKTIIDVLDSRILSSPNKVIMTYLKHGEFEEEVWTYKVLHKKATNLAAVLQQKLSKGERVFIILPQGLEYVAAIFACFYSGVIAVPAYPPKRNREDDRLQSILVNSGAKVIIGDEITLNRCKKFNSILCSKNWIETSVFSDNQKEFEQPQILEDDIALLQYTSGSTGDPKGVIVTHKNIMCNSWMLRRWFKPTENDLSISWLPIFHDMGLIEGIIQPIFSNHQMVLMAPLDFIQKPQRWLKALSLYKATRSGGPNFGFQHCCDRIEKHQIENVDLSQIKSLYNGSEPIRYETITAFLKKFEFTGLTANAIWPGYGLAEATLMVTGSNTLEPPRTIQIDKSMYALKKILIAKNECNGITLVSNGPPNAGVEIRIINPGTHTLSLPDEIGEVWLRGETVSPGYWNNPEATEQTFKGSLVESDEDNYLRTGDLGFLYDGELYITGRCKDLIIIRGRNYYPTDIETLVAKLHSGLVAGGTIAIGVEGKKGEELVIVQELKRSYVDKTEIDAIIHSIKNIISSRFEITLSAIFLIQEKSIPKTSSGKLQRQKCKQLLVDGKLKVLEKWISKSSILFELL